MALELTSGFKKARKPLAWMTYDYDAELQRITASISSKYLSFQLQASIPWAYAPRNGLTEPGRGVFCGGLFSVSMTGILPVGVSRPTPDS